MGMPTDNNHAIGRITSRLPRPAKVTQVNVVEEMTNITADMLGYTPIQRNRILKMTTPEQWEDYAKAQALLLKQAELDVMHKSLGRMNELVPDSNITEATNVYKAVKSQGTAISIQGNDMSIEFINASP